MSDLGRLILAIVALVAVLFMAVSLSKPPDEVEIQREITIPQGYTLVAASAHGQYVSVETWYCQQDGTNNIFVCTGGVIGQEIEIPDGYHLVAVSEYGKYVGTQKFYCQNDLSGTISVCR